MPVYFVSHGGGPWPYIDGMRPLYAVTEREFRAMSERLITKPKAMLVITGHWEATEFTVSTAQRPQMVYDYSGPIAQAFETYLHEAIEQTDARERNDMLVNWEAAPHARLTHPREDHLIPLMVIAGAAGNDTGRAVFVDCVMKVPMASYEFGRA